MTTFVMVGLFLCSAYRLDAQTTSPLDSVYAETVLREDLQMLKRLVLEVHPDPFIYCTPEAFDAAIDSAAKRVEGGMRYHEFAALVAEVLRHLQDSHTLVQYSAVLQPYRVMGGRFVDFDLVSLGDTLIVRSDREGILPVGSQIKLFGTTSASELYGRVSSFTLQEGESTVSAQRVTEVLFPSFLGVYTPLSDSVEIGIIPPLGDAVQTVSYPTRSSKELRKVRRKALKVDPTYDFQIYDGGKFAVLKIGTFDYKSFRRYSRMLKRSFKQLEKQGIEHFAIDLRDNTGGRANRVEELLTYFIDSAPIVVPANIVAKQSEASAARFKREFNGWSRFWLKVFTSPDAEIRKYAAIADMPVGSIDTVYFEEGRDAKRKFFFEGKSYLMMNGLSGSASSNFAAIYKSFQLGTIVGEPCLGPLSGTWGNPVPVRLKNTKLPLYISSIRFNLSNSFEYDPAPVMPDIPVLETLQSISDGRDRWMEVLREEVYRQGR